MTEESITFFHIAKNVFDAKDFVDKFRGGLKPIGADTGDSEQKQDGGLYFWGTRSQADAHTKWLTGELPGARANELSPSVGRVEFSVPLEKITFPEFRIDLEQNKIRAKYLEEHMFPVLDMLNSDKAKKEIWKDIQLGKGDELVEILKQERPYVENKSAKKDDKGDCLCFRVVNNGEERIVRAGVGDTEKAAVWLAENNPLFKAHYSRVVQVALTDKERIGRDWLAFKYCGEKPLEVSKMFFVSHEKGGYAERKVYDREEIKTARLVAAKSFGRT